MDLEDNNCKQGMNKRSRVGNGSRAGKLGHKDEEGKKSTSTSGGIVPWQNQIPSSRIYRVSRASGGKDRHSKVYTSKGLRDRRVRLSVSTAIQFYDIQDRLGYDQPSKAIEWLLKAAAFAITELPPLAGFPKFGEENGQIVSVGEGEAEADIDQNNFSQHQLATKSGSGSTSETSKGSVLSISRSECHGKAGEWARERAVKEKDKGREENSHSVASHLPHNLAPSHCSPTSFTELLTGNGNGNGGRIGATVTTIVATGANSSPRNNIQKQISTADYFSHAGLFTQKNHQLSAAFASEQSPFGNTSAMAMVPLNMAAAPEMHQQFSFMQDNLMPVSDSSDYNLNFTISSSLAGFNRETLQSNSLSQLPHHLHTNNHIQRLSSVNANNLPFFFSTAAPAATAPNAENQFLTGFDGSLQLCMKGKGKS